MYWLLYTLYSLCCCWFNKLMIRVCRQEREWSNLTVSDLCLLSCHSWYNWIFVLQVGCRPPIWFQPADCSCIWFVKLGRWQWFRQTHQIVTKQQEVGQTGSPPYRFKSPSPVFTRNSTQNTTTAKAASPRYQHLSFFFFSPRPHSSLCKKKKEKKNKKRSFCLWKRDEHPN